MSIGARVSAAVLVALLAGCQTGGNEGVLGSAVNDPNAPGDRVARAGDNPNARTRLKNTRTTLTDYCPAVRLRTGTESYRVVPRNGDKDDPAQVRFQATITRVARECAYEGGDLRIKVGARGRVITGPRGATGNFNMPIRVAVTRGDDTVYSKLHRPQTGVPNGASGAVFSFVDDQVVVPAPTATNLRVYIGFDEGPYNTP